MHERKMSRVPSMFKYFSMPISHLFLHQFGSWALLVTVFNLHTAITVKAQNSYSAKIQEPDYSEQLPRIPPKTPAEAIATFRIRDGFRIELAASEPEIASPVAIDFDEDGRLFVAEFPEFNQQSNQQPQGRGRIRLLEDTQDNGVYNKSTIFLEDVDTPTAVCCYAGGVFIGSVPNILYAKDTDGDGRADLRRVVYSGFGRDLLDEALLNSFHWSFDNRIHVQTSRSGGNLRPGDKPNAKPVSVHNGVLVFDARTEAFEMTSGIGQHALGLDDWGRAFVCTNTDPIRLVMYDRRYLSRNPYLEAPPAELPIAQGGYTSKVFRISPNEPWRVLRTMRRTTGIEAPHSTEGAEPSGYFTAASGTTVYRGDAWPKEYRGDVFVGEVANNLTYHARLEPRGLELIASRVESMADFLASTDIWHRPVQYANSPDGCLFLIDMYRHVIQGAANMTPAIVKHLDIGGGFDMGRLYRIVPNKFERRPTPRLSQASTTELVALLEHANGWHRDTASRLLYERQDRAAKEPLQKVAKESSSSLGRMHALYALNGLNQLDAVIVLSGLRDNDANVREHALRLAEQFSSSPEIQAQFFQMTEDADLHVRYQLAFSLGALAGELPNGALVRLAQRDGSDAWCRLALFSSVHGRAGQLFQLLLEQTSLRNSEPIQEILKSLARMIGSAHRDHEIAEFIQGANKLSVSDSSLRRELVRHLVTKLPPSASRMLTGTESGAVGVAFVELLRDAMQIAADEKQGVDERVTAIHLLNQLDFARVRELLAQLIHVRQPPTIQSAAMKTLARFDAHAVPMLLTEAWPNLSPQLRNSAMEAFFSRPTWLEALFDAIQLERIKPAEMGPTRILSLRNSTDNQLRVRALKLLGDFSLESRQSVVDAYQPALEMRGDPLRGQSAFRKNCSACHQLEGVGTQTGANLKAIRDQGLPAILLSILDPNREVKPEFVGQVLLTTDGRTVTGLITAETANSLTIRRSDGESETILRLDIEETRNTGVSFMPEGLEKIFDLQEMADLLSYLTSAKP